MTAKVQTVLGDVSPSVLGRTLTHEHLAMDFSHFYSDPPTQLADKFKRLPYTLDMIGYIRQYPYSSPYNLLFDDTDANSAVLDDLIAYKKFGGGTIAENTTEGIKRNVNRYKYLSEQSGVHIVAGTGHYIADTQELTWLKQSTEDIYNHMLKEVTEGCVEGPGIKAGFLGEIASVWPLRDFERKAIIAAGELQPQLKCGVSFHPHRIPDSPFEIIRLYLEAGGSKDKVVMSHLDRTLLQDDKLLEFAELGTYCQFDLFGCEVSYYQLSVPTDMPSDAQRMDKIALLVNDGRDDKILMSHDIHTKHRLIRYGGHGYSHIINNVLPKMKTIKGISQEVIDKITIENPARWLEIKN
ncbi:phosphotriesterase-related protein [Anticarsia gemmatalis]|uniref:phosphotriesterase-related protein n=1 Tax=Anticarsia gemmatalis TaxID=129554 RepID=UPI003F761B55